MQSQDAKTTLFASGVAAEEALALPDNRPQAVEQSMYRREPKRVQATVLFGDIVGSTERLAEMGDHQWMKVLDEYYAIIRKELGTFQAHHVSTAGDGFLATFDHPGQAVQCASAIRESVKALGLRIRIGMHVGECLSVGEFVGGLTVHIGARIAAAADAGEVLVSDAVKSHLADSAIRFVDGGSHDLKGVPWATLGQRRRAAWPCHRKELQRHRQTLVPRGNRHV
jgi:class 3 adenylate cyclase